MAASEQKGTGEVTYVFYVQAGGSDTPLGWCCKRFETKQEALGTAHVPNVAAHLVVCDGKLLSHFFVSERWKSLSIRHAQRVRVVTDPFLVAKGANEDPYEHLLKAIAQSGELDGLLNSAVAGVQDLSSLHNVKMDKAGNPMGAAFDLGRDGAFSDYTVLIFNEWGMNIEKVVEVIRAKGFRVNVLDKKSHPDKRKLEKAFLAQLPACDVCLMINSSSSDMPCDPAAVKAAIDKHWRSGKGFWHCVDNAPIVKQTNVWLAQFGLECQQNYGGSKDIFLKNTTEEPPKGTFKPHLVTTGVTSLFEGGSISRLQVKPGAPVPEKYKEARKRFPLAPFKTLAKGTDGHPCMCFSDTEYDPQVGRVLIETGFIDKCSPGVFGRGGVGRYVANCVVWLLGLEDRIKRREEAKMQKAMESQDTKSACHVLWCKTAKNVGYQKFPNKQEATAHFSTITEGHKVFIEDGSVSESTSCGDDKDTSALESVLLKKAASMLLVPQALAGAGPSSPSATKKGQAGPASPSSQGRGKGSVLSFCKDRWALTHHKSTGATLDAFKKVSAEGICVAVADGVLISQAMHGDYCTPVWQKAVSDKLMELGLLGEPVAESTTQQREEEEETKTPSPDTSNSEDDPFLDYPYHVFAVWGPNNDQHFQCVKTSKQAAKFVSALTVVGTAEEEKSGKKSKGIQVDHATPPLSTVTVLHGRVHSVTSTTDAARQLCLEQARSVGVLLKAHVVSCTSASPSAKDWTDKEFDDDEDAETYFATLKHTSGARGLVCGGELVLEWASSEALTEMLTQVLVEKELVQDRVAPDAVVCAVPEERLAGTASGELAATIEAKSLPKIPSTNPAFTVCAWVQRTHGQPAWTCLFSRGGTSRTPTLLVHPNTGVLRATYSTKSTPVVELAAKEAVSLPLREWTHVAFSINKRRLALYVNGKPVASLTSMEDVVYGPASELEVGSGDGLVPFRGSMHALSVRNVALPEASVEKVMQETRPSAAPANKQREFVAPIVNGFVRLGTYSPEDLPVIPSRKPVFTITAWLQILDAADDVSVVVKKADPTRTLALFVQPSTRKLQLQYSTAADFHAHLEQSGQGLALNSWTHVACIVNKSTVSLYVGGLLAASAEEKSDVLYDPAGALHVGMGETFSPFRGHIAYVRMHPTAYNATDVLAERDRGAPVEAIERLRQQLTDEEASKERKRKEEQKRMAREREALVQKKKLEEEKTRKLVAEQQKKEAEERKEWQARLKAEHKALLETTVTARVEEEKLVWRQVLEKEFQARQAQVEKATEVIVQRSQQERQQARDDLHTLGLHQVAAAEERHDALLSSLSDGLSSKDEKEQGAAILQAAATGALPDILGNTQLMASLPVPLQRSLHDARIGFLPDDPVMCANVAAALENTTDKPASDDPAQLKTAAAAFADMCHSEDGSTTDMELTPEKFEQAIAAAGLSEAEVAIATSDPRVGVATRRLVSLVEQGAKAQGLDASDGSEQDFVDANLQAAISEQLATARGRLRDIQEESLLANANQYAESESDLSISDIVDGNESSSQLDILGMGPRGSLHSRGRSVGGNNLRSKSMSRLKIEASKPQKKKKKAKTPKSKPLELPPWSGSVKPPKPEYVPSVHVGGLSTVETKKLEDEIAALKKALASTEESKRTVTDELGKATQQLRQVTSVAQLLSSRDALLRQAQLELQRSRVQFKVTVTAMERESQERVEAAVAEVSQRAQAEARARAAEVEEQLRQQAQQLEQEMKEKFANIQSVEHARAQAHATLEGVTSGVAEALDTLDSTLAQKEQEQAVSEEVGKYRAAFAKHVSQTCSLADLVLAGRLAAGGFEALNTDLQTETEANTKKWKERCKTGLKIGLKIGLSLFPGGAVVVDAVSAALPWVKKGVATAKKLHSMYKSVTEEEKVDEEDLEDAPADMPPKQRQSCSRLVAFQPIVDGVAVQVSDILFASLEQDSVEAKKIEQLCKDHAKLAARVVMQDKRGVVVTKRAVAAASKDTEALAELKLGVAVAIVTEIREHDSGLASRFCSAMNKVQKGVALYNKVSTGVQMVMDAFNNPNKHIQALKQKAEDRVREEVENGKRKAQEMAEQKVQQVAKTTARQFLQNMEHKQEQARLAEEAAEQEKRVAEEERKRQEAEAEANRKKKSGKCVVQ